MTEEGNILITISDDDSNERHSFNVRGHAVTSKYAVTFNKHANMTSHGTDLDSETAYKAQVVAVFPDICPEYLDGLAQKHGNNSSTLIASILDEVDNGAAIPTRQRSMLKRKRDDGQEEELGVEKLAKTYNDASRHAELRNLPYLKQAYVMASPSVVTCPARLWPCRAATPGGVFTNLITVPNCSCRHFHGCTPGTLAKY
jgi:hypothetical protein